MSRTALVVAARLIRRSDRPKYLELIEERARAGRASQIGANHVLEVVLETKYYTRLGEGLQEWPRFWADRSTRGYGDGVERVARSA